MTRFPAIAAERVSGIVLLSTLAKTPLGSHSTRAKARIEKITRRAPDMSWVWSSPNLGLMLARIGFGRDPQPSHVELVRQMLRDCPPETRLDAPRALIGLDLTADLPADPHTDARDRRYRRRAHSARARAPDRRPDPGRAARGVPGGRAHADARTRRRDQSHDRRLRARGRRRGCARRGCISRARHAAQRGALSEGERAGSDPDRGCSRRALDRRRDRGHGAARARRHRRFGRSPRRRAGEPRAGAARARPNSCARRCGGVRGRLGVRPRRGRRRDAVPRRARRRLPDRGRAGADRARGVRVRSGRGVAIRPGADEGYAAAVAAERGDPVPTGSRRRGPRRDGREVARSRARGRGRARHRDGALRRCVGRGVRGGERGRRRRRRRRR